MRDLLESEFALATLQGRFEKESSMEGVATRAPHRLTVARRQAHGFLEAKGDRLCQLNLSQTRDVGRPHSFFEMLRGYDKKRIVGLSLNNFAQMLAMPGMQTIQE